ncbi:hypothetical protein D9981_10780 [Pseudoalteromonas phenolica O-BC30]|nr:hypothetical protein D9981_10780 [Pseudoalteromonas phenolica O-BC30]
MISIRFCLQDLALFWMASAAHYIHLVLVAAEQLFAAQAAFETARVYMQWHAEQKKNNKSAATK